jgi:hypothetical protein
MKGKGNVRTVGPKVGARTDVKVSSATEKDKIAVLGFAFRL